MYLRLAAAVVALALGIIAAATTATVVSAAGYYDPAGNNVTWPVGPSIG